MRAEGSAPQPTNSARQNATNPLVTHFALQSHTNPSVNKKLMSGVLACFEMAAILTSIYVPVNLIIS
jgi:hypothetical protein